MLVIPVKTGIQSDVCLSRFLPSILCLSLRVKRSNPTPVVIHVNPQACVLNSRELDCFVRVRPRKDAIQDMKIQLPFKSLRACLCRQMKRSPPKAPARQWEAVAGGRQAIQSPCRHCEKRSDEAIHPILSFPPACRQAGKNRNPDFSLTIHT